MPQVKSVDQLQDKLEATAQFLSAMGANSQANELRGVCEFLQPHRGKTLEQLVNPPPADPKGTELISLYARAGSPGLSTDEIERVFATPAVKKMSVGDLKAIAPQLDVAPGKLKKGDLIAKMKTMVINRAGTHARVTI